MFIVSSPEYKSKVRKILPVLIIGRAFCKPVLEIALITLCACVGWVQGGGSVRLCLLCLPVSWSESEAQLHVALPNPSSQLLAQGYPYP